MSKEQGCVEMGLESLFGIMWRDLARRGLDQAWVREPCAKDFLNGCTYLARNRPAVGIVTGFYIPHANAWESDGPPGAVLLARCLAALGYDVRLYAEPDLGEILYHALCLAGLALPVVNWPDLQALTTWWQEELDRLRGREMCLIVIERPGPAHTEDSITGQSDNTRIIQRFLTEVPSCERDRLHTMQGQDISDYHWPVHRLLEVSQSRVLAIGDGGNEIGMGKLPWDLLARSVPQGARIACRVSADWLIIATVSNWGAYALAAGMCHLLGAAEFFTNLARPDAEHRLWFEICQRYRLCDGLTGQPAYRDDKFWIDGLPWPIHAQVLEQICETIRRCGQP